MSNTYQSIKLESADNGVWTLTINRPESLNALNLQVLHDMGDALRQISEMDFEHVKALIITGAGEKAFVAGADIKEMKDMNEDQAMQFAKRGQSIFHELSLLKVPVIAAVNGFALGGGCELALGCDFIIASENAKFGLPEVSLGLIPGFGGTVKLTRAVGSRRARELTMTAEIITAEAAMKYGLVNDVVPLAELIPAVMKKINLMLSRSPLAISQAKKSINEAYDLETEKALTNEADIFAQLFNSDDTREGMTAFIEKRKPNFQGN
ncbi:MAG: enoyl-CoA hydratase/isomerase family protein [Bdellovibrio sp.]|nr:enoyl-CoA hydratase/isomerase family protein [Bdellovibrio sp.]